VLRQDVHEQEAVSGVCRQQTGQARAAGPAG
jgi:hypothetical protein